MPQTVEEKREAARRRYHRRKREDPERVRGESVRSSRAYDARKRREGDAVYLAAEAERQRRINASLPPARRTERGRQANRRRQARRARLAPQSVEDRAYEAILRGDPCAYCGGTTKTIDHLDPLVRGGGNGWLNLAAACASCNSSKGTRPLVLFLAERRRPTANQ